MSAPTKNGALRGLGEPKGAILVVDPGTRCGICVLDPDIGYSVNTAQLDELPGLLRWMLPGPVFVVVEDYHLVKAVVQMGSDMPSSQGIGMCRTACEWTDTQMFLVPPNIKRAGHQALDAKGMAAWRSCRNEHERDVVDITGYVLREMRR